MYISDFTRETCKHLPKVDLFVEVGGLRKNNKIQVERERMTLLLAFESCITHNKPHGDFKYCITTVTCQEMEMNCKLLDWA